MAAMESGDRFGITFTGLGLDQHAFLEMRLELIAVKPFARRQPSSCNWRSL
jgi:hypothetical protein